MKPGGRNWQHRSPEQWEQVIASELRIFRNRTCCRVENQCWHLRDRRRCVRQYRSETSTSMPYLEIQRSLRIEGTFSPRIFSVICLGKFWYVFEGERNLELSDCASYARECSEAKKVQIARAREKKKVAAVWHFFSNNSSNL